MTGNERYHLAQLNIARTLAPLESPALKDFVDNLDRINALADGSPGFVWRLQGEGGNATDIAVENDPMAIVNMSVWESIESLFGFVFRSEHVGIMRRRREWFEKSDRPFMVLWWAPVGHRPTLEEAMERLVELEKNGPTHMAFTFKDTFPPPGDSGAATLRDREPERFCA